MIPYAKSEGLHGDEPAAASASALVDRRELAFIAVERTRMPMVVTDACQPDNPIVLANSAFLNLTGYTAEEVIGRNCRMLQGRETQPEAIAQIRSAMAEGRDITLELINYRKDGSSFWNQLHLSPIHDDFGRLIYFFGSQQDVTDRRRAYEMEAVERRLLKEVDHRAMNALAIVEGIVRLSNADDPQRYAQAIQERVQALARAHALLAGQGWRAVELSALIATQISFYGASRISVAGPQVALPGQIVQPLALVLHELMLNAARHGALSNRSGALSLNWRTDPVDHGLRLTWRESGGPAPLDRRPTGFGARMIGATVRRQLRGSISETWAKDGLQVDISIPMTV